MKFFHVSDVNLGYIPDKGTPWSERRKNDIYTTFQNILDACEEQQVDALFLTGNIFSHIPLEGELRDLDQKLKCLTKTKTFLLTGEKEAFSFGAVYELFPWESATTVFSGAHFEQVPVDEWKCSITGVSYDEVSLDTISWKSLHRSENHQIQILLLPKLPEQAEQVKQLSSVGYDYIGYGNGANCKMSDETGMYFPGTPEPLSLEHTRVHGYISGELFFDENGEIQKKIQFIECAVCEYVVLQVNISETMTPELLEEQMQQAFEDYGKENIYKIILKGKCDDELFLTTDKLSKYGNVIKIENQTESDFSIEDILSKGNMDMVSRYARKISDLPDGPEKKYAIEYGINVLLSKQAEEK